MFRGDVINDSDDIDKDSTILKEKDSQRFQLFKKYQEEKHSNQK